MFKVAWSSIRANKVRLLLTSFAIVIGVSFVAGSFVFTDTISTRLEKIFTDIAAGVDVYVQPTQPEFGTDFGSIQLSMPDTVLEDVLAVDGVAVAEPSVGGTAQLVGKDGEVVGGFGPPTLGFSWSDDPDMTPLHISPDNGRPPQAPGEVAIDAGTARTQGYTLGDTVRVITTGPVEEFTLVGIATFGEGDNVAGATLVIFDLAEAQRVFGMEGRISQISVAADPGVTAEELASRIGDVVPDGVEAITATQSNADQTAALKEGLNFLTIGLLVFAIIAVFVGSFVIYNTFRIIVAQRTRELALLRAIGATSGQVTRMVVLEAFIVALISSLVGILGGIALSSLLAKALSAGGAALPMGPLTLLPRTIIVSLLVGIIVTVVASILPARRAASIPPVAAIRADLSATPRKDLRRRTFAGLIVVGLGAAMVIVGLFSEISNAALLVGVGAAVTFLGVSILAPLATGPFAQFVGWPIATSFRVAGDLAVKNTRREPRRTASTASALMIGVSLVVFVAIFGASIKSSIGNTLREVFPADLSISSTSVMGGVSPQFADELRALPEIGHVTSVNAAQIRFEELDMDTTGSAIDPDTSEGLVFTGATPEALARLAETDGMLVLDQNKDPQFMLGETYTLEFPNGASGTAEVVGVFTDTNFGDFIITRDRYITSSDTPTDQLILANAADGVSVDEAAAAANELTVEFPNVKVQTKSEFVADAESQIDGILAIFTGLLALAIVIAILGITNTLALSIIERTREIGLLRAVGMSRRQLRRMVRWEAVIIALFGAMLGIAMGIVLGWVVILALADEGLGDFVIPAGQLIVLILVAGIAGVAAAIYPAWNASRLNILDAIAYE